ncbi:GNAT family N-acetyltransferase [Herbidospora galbida]|uniref:GNAT family N-acetyltransferase n=1 Tax=Herbidospora galbida TaxID=2575442 RepID=A0A4V5UZA5_9ACTN|nr:GNAT family N-acetyltransferase [Herbidospora galbida]TKK87693.1 GNAT family N-acetyltransferase [Herbidospora galbida]
MQRTQVDVRPAGPDDADGVRKFLLDLSLRTQTHRFFAGLTRPTNTLIGAMLARDDRRDALLATVDSLVIGHAMAYRKDDEAEIAVVVADDWQNQGIGSRLIRELLARAPGIRWVTMDVMGENRRVLNMINRAWPEAEMAVEHGSVQVRASLAFAEQSSVRPPLMV